MTGGSGGHLARLWDGESVAGLTDGQLLDRFATGRGSAAEAAFAALVARHGPMVLSVCRRLLHQVQDIEDAFQATFLVLAVKAPSIRQPASLACWIPSGEKIPWLMALLRNRIFAGSTKIEVSGSRLFCTIRFTPAARM